MALTYSQDIELDSEAPAFDLPAANASAEHRIADTYSLSSFAGAKVLVVIFTCNHCPYAKHVEDTLIRLARENRNQGVRFVAVSSNDPAKYPEDSFENMAKRAREKSYPFPYLFDETQEVARAYGALCTPDVYVFLRSREGQVFRLKYHGRVDDTRPNKGTSTGNDLQRAINEVLYHGAVTFEQHPSMGCNIKWKAGNEPPL
jgi:peroxiredoxin